MNAMWVILNDDKSAVIEVFETIQVDSKPFWDKFMQHKAGTVFCRRKSYLTVESVDWYVSYYYWDDVSTWGYGEPVGLAWSACMALPEPIKMLELLE